MLFDQQKHTLKLMTLHPEDDESKAMWVWNHSRHLVTVGNLVFFATMMFESLDENVGAWMFEQTPRLQNRIINDVSITP